MDTLSTPITNLQVPKPYNPNHHNHHHNYLPTSAVRTTSTPSISTNTQKDNFTPLISYYPQRNSSPPRATTLSSSTKLRPPRAPTHRRAASGYAAALLDISRCNDTLLRVEKDVRRLLKVVFRSNDAQVREFMRDEHVEEKMKGKVLIELMMKGKFEGNLVGLVKMLVNKGHSVMLVKEVLEEFLSVFHQLTTTSCAPSTKLAMS